MNLSALLWLVYVGFSPSPMVEPPLDIPCVIAQEVPNTYDTGLITFLDVTVKVNVTQEMLDGGKIMMGSASNCNEGIAIDDFADFYIKKPDGKTGHLAFTFGTYDTPTVMNEYLGAGVNEIHTVCRDRISSQCSYCFSGAQLSYSPNAAAKHWQMWK